MQWMMMRDALAVQTPRADGTLCKVIHEYVGTAHAPDGQRVLGAWFLAAKRGPLTPQPQCGTSWDPLRGASACLRYTA
jgi:hypothetical protein